MRLVEFLEGKKTYIVSVLVALYGVLTAFDIIMFTEAQEASVWALLAALFGIALRAGVNKI